MAGGGVECAFPGCGRPGRYRSDDGGRICSTHYKQQAAGKPLTAVRTYGAKAMAARVEDARWLLDCGEHPEHVAQRVGMAPSMLHRAMRESGTPHRALSEYMARERRDRRRRS